MRRSLPLFKACRVARRLERSRFVAWQLYWLAAGGSRERLEVRQFYVPLSPRNRIDAMGKNIALGHSREPPAANQYSCHLAKRLPSRTVGLRLTRVP
jgi:hypothetical protein